MALVIGLVVAAVLVVGALAVLSPGGSSSLALVFEPGNNGYGDVHFVKLGDPINRETRALRDVQLVSNFNETLFGTQWAARGQMAFEVGGGRLIAYSEEGDDDGIVAVVNGIDVTPVVEESGWMSVVKANEGAVLVRFNDNDTGRCQIYRIDGVDEVERLGRGDSCAVFPSGDALVIDSGSRGSDISLFRSDGSSTEFETDDRATRGRVSPGGSLLALTLEDSDSGASVGVYLFDAATGTVLNDMRTRNDSGAWLGAVIDSGAFVTVSDSGGGQVLYFLTAEDSSVVVEGDRVDVVVNPAGDLAHVRATYWEDDLGEYSVWNPLVGILSDSLELTLNVENPMGWASNEVALIVDPDGDIHGLSSEGIETDLGDVGDDSGWGWSSMHEGGLVTIQTTSPDLQKSLTVLPQNVTAAVTVLDAFSLEFLKTSADGRYVVLSALDDSDDRYRTLYVYDTESDDLIEIDDNATFSNAQFVGDTVVYTGYDTDGDAETLQFSWTSGEQPEVLYRDAIAIVP